MIGSIQWNRHKAPLLLVLGVVFSIGVVFLSGQSARAAVTRGGFNASENRAIADCVGRWPGFTIGASWINSGVGNLWANTVQADVGQTTIDAWLYSTSYVCGAGPSGITTYGSEIGNMSPLGGGRIAFPFGDSVYRGDASTGQFTGTLTNPNPNLGPAPNGPLRVRIDVGNVPTGGCFDIRYTGRFYSRTSTGVLQVGITRDYTATVCVQRNQNWILAPAISANRTTAEPSELVVVTPRVNNVGGTASANNQWQLSRFIIPATGGSYPPAGNSASPPAVYYGNGLTRLDGGTGISYPPGTTTIGSRSEVVPDVPAGSRVCYALSVQARAFNDVQWAHSTAVCVTIGKKPKVQVQGGDLSVGRPFVGVTGVVPVATVLTNTSRKNIAATDRTFGSWIEYGIFATGTIRGAASGSAYANPGLTGATLCNTSPLSFANTTTATGGCNNSLINSIGNYAARTSIPDVEARFATEPSTSLGGSPSINLAAAPRLQGVYTANGNVTISGGGGASRVAKGQWVVINAPNSTVTITGNIIYTTEPLQEVSDIPQVVIIARNINIVGEVTQIDAWLIAKGTTMAVNGVINTCTSSGGMAIPQTRPLTTALCNQPLTVNGPVMAQKLALRRTAGSGTGATSGDPAEVFNLRADAYLWASARANTDGRIQTIYTTELPPRL